MHVLGLFNVGNDFYNRSTFYVQHSFRAVNANITSTFCLKSLVILPVIKYKSLTFVLIYKVECMFVSWGTGIRGLI